MSTVNDSGDEGSWIGRRVTDIAHLFPYAVVATIPARIPHYLGWESPWWTAVYNVVLAVIAVELLHSWFVPLCVRCMQDMPANPGEQAERRRWMLRASHLFKSGWGYLAFLALLVGGNRLIQDYGWPRVAVLPADLAFAVFLYSIWVHHRLRLWCPYCRDWGDGGGIVEPSPNPVEKATR